MYITLKSGRGGTVDASNAAGEKNLSKGKRGGGKGGYSAPPQVLAAHSEELVVPMRGKEKKDFFG